MQDVQIINISLPKPLLKRIDEAAAKEFRNRSELIREATRSYLKEQERWESIFNRGREAGRKLGIKSEEDAYKIVNEYRHSR
ncbi:MAG TPA: ribbon-helix-helix protein, CopG family [Candidatus Nanoarchaeia archaeon]